LLSDLGHLALDAVGLIPVVGEVADLANAAWYYADGDYLNAGLSAAGAVPFVGWAATGGKFAVKGVRSVDGARTWLNGRPVMVPPGAREIPFTPNGPFQIGQKYTWTAPSRAEPGQDVNYFLHAHGKDPGPNAGPNASSGPTYRIHEEVGNKKYYYDAAGTPYRSPNAFNANSPHYVPAAANDTHIPYPKDLPRPDLDWHEVAVSNPAPAVGPEPEYPSDGES
jgi:hypothetical protein